VSVLYVVLSWLLELVLLFARGDRAKELEIERGETVDAGVVSVRGHRSASEPPPSRQAHLRRELVAGETNNSGRCEHPQVREVFRLHEALDRHVERDAGGDEDREDDREPSESLLAHAAQKNAIPSGTAVKASPKL
jgi:hypothetical protein